MKKIIFNILASLMFVLASCSGSSSSSSSSPDSDDGEMPEEVVSESIKVMAYNIHHANPPSKPDVIDINAIVNAIRNQNPDVVALQEVDVNTKRSGSINEAEKIAEQLDMNFFFGKAIDYDEGEYGVAILSKFPLSETVVNKLPVEAGTNGEPRILLTAKIKTPKGYEVRFGSTHLDAQSASTNRLVQIQEIIDIAKDEDLPFIIAGDFNALPQSEVIGILDDHFVRSCRLCPFTIPASNPSRTIDYIAFHHPDNKFEVEGHKVVDESYASDHRPVTAVVKIME
ncbi:MAG: endonuclease/exonuclease/phosphatase family protein [Christiangramia sp.]|uniref:endonuclease/exonuclease/phosphatase family protein n=1 Tax=Christiangramia sp. TaxID=1931228 RepID=UPI00324272E4